MKREKDQKSQLLEMLLQGVRKTAERGAGMASTKGVFEPEVPEKLEKSDRGGAKTDELNSGGLQICAMICAILLIGICNSIWIFL